MPRPCLDWDAACAIRLLAAYAPGITRAGLARHYGVTLSLVCHVLRGNRWAWPTGHRGGPERAGQRRTPAVLLTEATRQYQHRAADLAAIADAVRALQVTHDIQPGRGRPVPRLLAMQEGAA